MSNLQWFFFIAAFMEFIKKYLDIHLLKLIGFIQMFLLDHLKVCTNEEGADIRPFSIFSGVPEFTFF